MKKIYSVTVILLSLWAPSVNAQGANCPAGANARAFIGAAACYVSIQGAIPFGQINVQSADGTVISPIPAPFTDASGGATVFYSCNTTPSIVTIAIDADNFCRLNIPAPISLPIVLKSFTAQSQGNNSVVLRWTSVFEANSSKFVVQKSLDGRNFSDISDVKAAGNSSLTVNYSFIDRNMASGAAYYRLKLMDVDGLVDYTKIIYINNGQVMFGKLSVFPNPFRSEVQLKGVPASDVNSKNVKLYNAMGSEMAYRVLSGNSIIIDPSLPKGVYILRVKGEAFKLFKE